MHHMYCFDESIVEINIYEHIITQVHNLKQQSMHATSPLHDFTTGRSFNKVFIVFIVKYFIINVNASFEIMNLY